jgi:hypothetical protein
LKASPETPRLQIRVLHGCDKIGQVTLQPVLNSDFHERYHKWVNGAVDRRLRLSSKDQQYAGVRAEHPIDQMIELIVNIHVGHNQPQAMRRSKSATSISWIEVRLKITRLSRRP